MTPAPTFSYSCRWETEWTVLPAQTWERGPPLAYADFFFYLLCNLLEQQTHSAWIKVIRNFHYGENCFYNHAHQLWITIEYIWTQYSTSVLCVWQTWEGGITTFSWLSEVELRTFLYHLLVSDFNSSVLSMHSFQKICLQFRYWLPFLLTTHPWF